MTVVLPRIKARTLDAPLPNNHPWPPRYMTEAQFEAWGDEDVKAEWSHEEVTVHMPEATKHNRLTVWLATLIQFFIDYHTLGEVFVSQVEIRAPGVRRVPDVCFVAKERQSIIKRGRIEGAPDLIIEIVSPDSEERDTKTKYQEYEQMGVREYWVIDSAQQKCNLYELNAARHYVAVKARTGKLHSRVLDGFWLRPSDLWQDPLPKTLGLLKELGVI